MISLQAGGISFPKLVTTGLYYYLKNVAHKVNGSIGESTINPLVGLRRILPPSVPPVYLLQFIDVFLASAVVTSD